MRKMTNLFIAACIVSAALISCKKDHTCTCTYQDAKTGQFATLTSTFNDTKGKAKDKCNEKGNYLHATGAFNITCGL